MTEVWKDIKGYEGHYQISNIGRVKSLARMRFGKGGCLSPLKERILKQKTSKSGYKSVHLRCMDYQSHPTIHRIVAEAFIDNPDNKPTVNHIDANKENNHVDNLEWITQSQNTRYAFLKGNKSQKGEKNNMAKLTMEKVKEIRKFKEENDHLSQQQIADHFNLKRENVKDIINYKTWNY